MPGIHGPGKHQRCRSVRGCYPAIADHGPVTTAGAGLMPEGSMRHDWIFDVLSDLKDYALSNALPELASSVDLALTTARREIAGADRSEPGGSGPLPRQRAH